MARQLDRVFVLPNVGRSRLAACHSFTFDFYYSLELIQQSSPNITFITQNQFLQWNQEMKAIGAETPTAHLVHLYSEHIKSPKLASDLVDFEPYQRKFCLQPFDNLRYSKEGDRVIEDIIVTPKYGFRSQENQAKVTPAIIRSLQSVKSDVMLIRCDSYWMIDGPNPPEFVYADHWAEQAKAAAGLLYPYIAIHWRMETANPDYLYQCSQNLVKYIQRAKARTGIANVYISTDYPIDGGYQRSGTFHNITQEHHRAAELLKNSVNLYTWERIKSSLPFFNETKFLTHGKDLDDAHGTLALTEKLILAYANWFVSGPRECCRFESSYTSQVVDERAKIIERQPIDAATNSKLWNLRDFWNYE
ncbi:9482_t:CDS:1 [Paraglomus occultum]|uniref:9482_t:CDS:1 n=1 Tax=Paraglomus occultum TaxID=144539 RepID=A0A9N9D844_9GLOM|nr:9482_t:CDS:1 [Paraglomus occultum]